MSEKNKPYNEGRKDDEGKGEAGEVDYATILG